MIYEPRSYQRQAIDSGLSFLRQKKAPKGFGLIVAPTGSGKSIDIAGIVAGLDAPALVFQPTLEILNQNLEKMQGYGYQPAVYSASANRKEIGQVTLATIGSVRRTPDLFKDVRYVIIDEAHLVNPARDRETKEPTSVYGQFFKAMGPDVRGIGLTATPYRLSVDGYGGAMLKFLTRTRPKIFTDVLQVTQIQDLEREGYLVRPTYHEMPTIDQSKIQVNKSGTEYDDDAIRRALSESLMADKLARVVGRLLERGRRRILVFVPFVEEARRLAGVIPEVQVVHGEMPAADRRQMIAWFRSGQIPCVVNVGVLGTGFDYPELDTVVLARPTLSLALYYQQVGRCVRPHSDKPDAWVVDMVGLVKMFGRIEDLQLRPGGKRGGSWAVWSGDRQLTNSYYGER